MHPSHCRADRNVGDDMSLAGLQVHSSTPPGTSSLGMRVTPFKKECQAQLSELAPRQVPAKILRALVV